MTERCVFRAAAGTLELIEIAPGIDLQRDILDRMAFQPAVSPALRQMDGRLFTPAPMGLRGDLAAMPRQARAPRRRVAA